MQWKKLFLPSSIIIVFNIGFLGLSYSQKDIAIAREKSRRAFYSYFMKSYENEALQVSVLWRRKYGKSILHRKYWQIGFERLHSQGRRPDCVPTCIATIYDYYHIKHNPAWKIGRRIRSKWYGKESGTSLYNAIQELKRGRLNVCVYSGSISDLKEKIETGTPVIVLQDYSEKRKGGHARIVAGFNDMKSELTVIDPNFGNKKCYVSYKKFMELWEDFSFCTILAFK